MHMFSTCFDTMYHSQATDAAEDDFGREAEEAEAQTEIDSVQLCDVFQIYGSSISTPQCIQSRGIDT